MSESRGGTGETIRILYIDDDEELALLMRKNLGRRGFKLEWASDGATGLAVLAEGGIEAVHAWPVIEAVLRDAALHLGLREAPFDLLDVGVGLLLLTLQVTDLGVGGDQVTVDHGLLGDQVLQGLVLGQRRALVRDLIQLQVEILQVQQPALDGGLGVQSQLLRSDPQRPGVRAEC